MRASADSAAVSSTRGVQAIGAFLIFATAAATLSGITLVWPGTLIDRIWVLNPRAYRELAPYGSAIGIPFLLLGSLTATIATGWFRRRLWAWRLTVTLLPVQMLGDLGNAAFGHRAEGAVGVVLAGALLIYLWSAPIRAAFAPLDARSGSSEP